MQNKIKYHTVATIPKSNIKIVERGKIITAKTKIHSRLVHKHSFVIRLVHKHSFAWYINIHSLGT